MKNLVKFILLIACILSLQVKSQSQPTTCAQFLQDFIPLPTDSVLDVEVVFWAFSPTTGTGAWDSNTPARALQCLRMVDSLYAHNPVAQQSNGEAHIPDTRIRFHLKAFFSKNYYVSPLTLSDLQNSSHYKYFYNPDSMATNYRVSHAINVYFGSDTTSGVLSASTNTLTRSVIKNAGAGIGDMGTSAMATIMGHEFGHVLGLSHTTNTETTVMQPPGSCCTSIPVNDYTVEDANTLIFCDCDSLNQFGYPPSNNFMSQNAGCNRYFSPLQMAMMHYHLRTDYADLLTPGSFDSGISRNAAADYSVTTNEGWTNDRYFKGSITVKSGNKLIIGCVVGITKGSRIIVEKGALLVVEGGTVTNVSGQIWDGIQVEGDPGLDQQVALNGFSGQGVLLVENYGEISNASNGAMNYTTDRNGVKWGTVGGIIRGWYGNFINNRRDVEFLGGDSYLSSSKFEFCQFKTTRLLNESIPPFAHVSLNDMDGVLFLGCNFEYSGGSDYDLYDRGSGIFSIDANYYVNHACTSLPASYCYSLTPCTFKNLTRGVHMANINPMHAATIVNSRFEDNTLDGIYFHNSYHFMLRENYFRTAEVGSNGIYLNSCKYYTVKNNTLEEDNNAQQTNGMYIYNSRDGAHTVYRNNFSGFKAAMQALDNNCGNDNAGPGLKMNCNDFTSSANEFDIAMLGNGTGPDAPTVMKKQGAVVGTIGAGDVVRNKYGASCNDASKWYVAGAGTNTITIDHGSNSDFGGNSAVTQPTPQPACSNAIVNVIAVAGPLNYAVDCAAYPPYITVTSGFGDNLNLLNSNMSTQRALGASADFFELQSCMAGKIDIFLKDSIDGGSDSVVDILTANEGNMNDAGVQLAFVYLNKGNYTAATDIADAMADSDWRALIYTLTSIYQEPDQLFSIRTNDTYGEFLESLANGEEKGGKGIAQALLYFVSGTPYTEPRPFPGDDFGRHTQQAADVRSLPALGRDIAIYPNPAQNVVTVAYYSKEDGAATLEIKDILGKFLYSSQVVKDSENVVSLNNYNNGIYIITITKNKELLYKSKLVKQD